MSQPTDTRSLSIKEEKRASSLRSVTLFPSGGIVTGLEGSVWALTIVSWEGELSFAEKDTNVYLNTAIALWRPDIGTQFLCQCHLYHIPNTMNSNATFKLLPFTRTFTLVSSRFDDIRPSHRTFKTLQVKAISSFFVPPDSKVKQRHIQGAVLKITFITFKN